MPGRRTAVKRLLLGRPRATRVLAPVLLPKRLAVPVLGSDLASSIAYGPGQLALVLALAGASGLLWPLTLGVVALLAILIAAYRQLVLAYPHGGGAYAVAREQLGEIPGMLAAASRFTELALAVTVAAAAAAATAASVLPGLADHRVAVALGLLAVVSVGKLRGLKESGTASALPAVAFAVTILALGIAGVVQCALTTDGCASADTGAGAAGAVTTGGLPVVLVALSIGAVALAGTETIADGVGGLHYPQSRNTATTLTVAAAATAALLVIVTALIAATGAGPGAGPARPALSAVTAALLGEGVAFALAQVAVAAVLLLAASSAYADLPRLASVLAGDRFLPRHLVMRGDRLVFSNALLLVGLGAAVLLVLTGADLARLIPLYVVAVFPSFVLALWGLARRHASRRERGWRRRVAVTVLGAAACALVLVVATVAGAAGGTWAVWLAMALLVAWMRRIRHHYRWVNHQIGLGTAVRVASRPNHVVLLLERVNEATARAVSYVRTIAPASLEAVAIPAPGADVERRWRELAPEVPLEVLGLDGASPAAAVRTALQQRAAAHGPDAVMTALVPDRLSRSWFDQLTQHRLALHLEAGLLARDGVVTTTLTSPEGGPGPYTIEDPAEHHVVVLVSGVHQATMRALAYAEGLRASTMRALTVNIDPQATRRTLSAWERSGLTTPLELVDSPLREMSTTLRRYLREFEPDGRLTVVSCVVPELVLPYRIQQPLHNQTAMLVKSTLLFERGVVTIAVPTRVPAEEQRPERPAGARDER